MNFGSFGGTHAQSRLTTAPPGVRSHSMLIRETQRILTTAETLIGCSSDIVVYVAFVSGELALSPLPHIDVISCVPKQTINIDVRSSLLA
jgi:hypothetical protein